MKTVEDIRLQQLEPKLYGLYVKDATGLIASFKGVAMQGVESSAFYDLWDIATELGYEHRDVLSYAWLTTFAWKLKIPGNYFELSPFEQGAVRAGLCNYLTGAIEPFVVLTPTEYAESLGYTEMYYPKEEGLQKWEEYKKEGLDSLFYMYSK